MSRIDSSKLMPIPRGFTLIEILVALVIFSVLSVLTIEGLSALVSYSERSRSAYQLQNDLHRSSAILMQDLLHLRPRPIRDRLGGSKRAYDTRDADYAVEFTRGGLPSFGGNNLGGLQRVAYSVSADKELLRWSWPTLDAFSSEQPRSQVLMTEVEAITFYQLNAQNDFEENWPPLNQTVAIDELPRMIRVEIELLGGAKIERLIPGIQPGSSSAGDGASGNSQEDAEESAESDS